MADDRMAVLDTVRKAMAKGDIDFLREGVRVLTLAGMGAAQSMDPVRSDRTIGRPEPPERSEPSEELRISRWIRVHPRGQCLRPPRGPAFVLVARSDFTGR